MLCKCDSQQCLLTSGKLQGGCVTRELLSSLLFSWPSTRNVCLLLLSFKFHLVT